MRQLSTYQSVFLLIGRGDDINAKGLLRNMTETAMVMAACAHSSTFTNEYLVADEFRRVQLIKSVLAEHFKGLHEGKEPVVSEKQVDSMRRDVKEFKTLAADKDSEAHNAQSYLDRVKIEEIARRGGMLDVYHLHYNFLCLFAHPSPQGMRDFLRVDEKGVPIGFVIGPSYEEATVNLRVAMVMTLEALNQHAFFTKDDSISPALQDFDRRLDYLFQTNNDAWPKELTEIH